MLKDPKGLGGQILLGHAMKMENRRLRRPADGEAPMDMGLRPIEDAAQLVPIGYVLEGQALDGRRGDDETLEALGTDFLPGTVKGSHMVRRRIARDVTGDPNERQFDLKRRRTHEPCDLRLGGDLVGHQVQQRDAQRPDVLARCITFPHDHQALRFERAASGQFVGNLDRHSSRLPVSGRRAWLGPFDCRLGHILLEGSATLPGLAGWRWASSQLLMCGRFYAGRAALAIIEGCECAESWPPSGTIGARSSGQSRARHQGEWRPKLFSLDDCQLLAPVLLSLPRQNAPSGLRAPSRTPAGPWRARHSRDKRDVLPARRTERQGAARPP